MNRSAGQRLLFVFVACVALFGGMALTLQQTALSEAIVGAQLAVFGAHSPLVSGLLLLLGIALLVGLALSAVYRGRLLAVAADAVQLSPAAIAGFLAAVGGVSLAIGLWLSSPNLDNPQRLELSRVPAASASPQQPYTLVAVPDPGAAQGWYLPAVPARFVAGGVNIYDAYTPLVGEPGGVAAVFYVSRSEIGKPDTPELIAKNPSGFLFKRKLPIAVRHAFRSTGVEMAETTYVFTRTPPTMRRALILLGFICLILAPLLAAAKWSAGRASH